MSTQSPSPEKSDEDGKKQHSSSGIPKEDRKKRTLSESSDKDKMKTSGEFTIHIFSPSWKAVQFIPPDSIQLHISLISLMQMATF